MSDLLLRTRTVLTAVVFWLGVAGAIIAAVLAELGPQIDQPIVSTIVAWLLPIATVIATLAAIIRRVSEVIPADRGLIPIPYPTVRSRRDGGFANNDVVWTLVGILAIVALIIWIASRV